jgi:glycerophosphoryl diester phosphodiesterase
LKTHPADLFRETVRDLRAALLPLIGFAIAFHILSTAVFSPLTWWMLTWLLKSSGARAIGNTEIAAFIASPIGVVFLLLAGSIALARLFAQQVGVITIGARTRDGRRVSLFATLRHLLGMLPLLLRLGGIQIGILLLVSVPFVVAGALTWSLLLSQHDIYFYATVRPPAFWIALSLGGLLLASHLTIAAILYLRWVHAVPLVVFRGVGARQALRDSHRLARGSYVHTALILGGWLLAFLFVGAALTFLLQLFGNWLLGRVGHEFEAVIPTVAALAVVFIGVALVLRFIWFNGHCLLVRRLYVNACRRLGEPTPAESLPATVAEEAPRRLTFRTAAALTTLVLVAFTAYVGRSIATNIERITSREILVTAHRGSSRDAPENSLSAIRKAIEHDADYAEIDVQETRDGTIVVMHDVDLQRIAGDPRRVWEIDYAEMRTLDAGSWFAPEFATERIPTLEQAIETARGRIRLNIELKFHGREQRFVERVLEIIDEHDFASQCVITSLDFDGLTRVKQRRPEVKTGFIVSAAVGDVRRLDVDFFSLQAGKVSRRSVRHLHAHDRQVHAWTVNDARGATRMIAAGVDNIITDEPEMIRSVLDEHRSLSPEEKVLFEFQALFLR